MVSLAKPRGDRIVLYNFNREITSDKSKELFQLKAITAEVKMDFTLPINRDWKITKIFQLSEEHSPETASYKEGGQDNKTPNWFKDGARDFKKASASQV